MIILSLLLNIFVLIPVIAGLVTDAEWVCNTYGERSPARGILLSIYVAILVVSVGLLFFGQSLTVASLLIVQVVYKVTSPFTVGTIRNPVVISNLFIAIFHTATLVQISRSF